MSLLLDRAAVTFLQTIVCQDEYQMILQEITLINIFVVKKYRNKAERWSCLPKKIHNFLDPVPLGLCREFEFWGNLEFL